MAVGLKLGSITDEIGRGDFLFSFFSTISGNLEPNGWGTRFPILLNKLYHGKLERIDASQALAELRIIEKELKQFTPDQVIWDIQNRDKLPPWGKNISLQITDLSNYFVTSTGRQLIPLIQKFLDELNDNGGLLQIV
jgi:hypothetical protein